jgi:nicotinate-nucleotide pyrophosphorylase (carboxylating)
MDDIDRYLNEDLGEEGDITSDSLFSDESADGKIIVKEDCIVAGLKEAEMIFNKSKVNIALKVKDGDFIKKGTIVAIMNGQARSILKLERLVLNILGRMSGIATETKKLIEICRQHNTKVTIAATRKTTPGFRKYEKKAVEIGGGEPHRFGLFDAVMIKDNHIKLIGSVEEAIKITKTKVKSKIIEVEVENEEDAIIAAKLYVDVIMLDNFDPKSAEAVTKKVKKINPNILVEISGGITVDNITDYASFADRISLGYLTNSINCKDFSLEFI